MSEAKAMPRLRMKPGRSVSKKSSNGWAFSYLDGIINMGDERCWNAEKWIVVS